MGIADLNLGVRTGEQYVQEWAIYPTSEGGDYYTFINALRQDQWGSVTTRLNGTGYLSMNSNLPAIDVSGASPTVAVAGPRARAAASPVTVEPQVYYLKPLSLSLSLKHFRRAWRGDGDQY